MQPQETTDTSVHILANNKYIIKKVHCTFYDFVLVVIVLIPQFEKATKCSDFNYLSFFTFACHAVHFLHFTVIGSFCSMC